MSWDGKAVVNAIQERASSHILDDLSPKLTSWAADMAEGDDVGLKNLEGGHDAKQAVGQWIPADTHGIKKLRMMRNYLVGCLRDMIDDALKQIEHEEEGQTACENDVERARGWADLGGYALKEGQSDEDTDDDDERGRMAHEFFAPCSIEDEIQTSSRARMSPIEGQMNVTPTKGSLPTPGTSPRRARQSSTLVPSTRSRNKANKPRTDVTKEDACKPSRSDKHKAPPTTLELDPFRSRSIAIVSSNLKNHDLVRSSTPDAGKTVAKLPCVTDAPDFSNIAHPSQNIKRPISPRTLSRRTKREARRRIAEKLSLARPDLVVPSYVGKHKQALSSPPR